MYECVYVCVCVHACEFLWKLSMGFFEVLLKLFNEAGRYEWQLWSFSYTLLYIERDTMRKNIYTNTMRSERF